MFTNMSTGFTVPTARYDASINESFPNPLRTYRLDSLISSRYFRDYLPVNANLNNGSINDSYIEFILNSSEQAFIDLSSFALEIKLKITKKNGEDIDENAKLNLIDGFSHRLLSRCTLYLNGTPIENSPYFGL